MTRWRPLVFLLLPLLLSCANTDAPMPIEIPCRLSGEEFARKAQDSLLTYGFTVRNLEVIGTKTSIQSSRVIRDGIADREVFVVLHYDSLQREAVAVVSINIGFRRTETRAYFDESKGHPAVYRSDFKPAIAAIRQMCAPKKRKKSG